MSELLTPGEEEALTGISQKINYDVSGRHDLIDDIPNFSASTYHHLRGAYGMHGVIEKVAVWDNAASIKRKYRTLLQGSEGSFTIQFKKWIKHSFSRNFDQEVARMGAAATLEAYTQELGAGYTDVLQRQNYAELGNSFLRRVSSIPLHERPSHIDLFAYNDKLRRQSTFFGFLHSLSESLPIDPVQETVLVDGALCVYYVTSDLWSGITKSLHTR